MFKLTSTLAEGPLGTSVPPVDETLSQTDVLARVHDNEFVPRLLKVKLCVVKVNGPPIPPVALKPFAGVTSNGSGMANALIKICPAGVPQPVQRSYPFTAKNFEGLVELSLFPVVI